MNRGIERMRQRVKEEHEWSVADTVTSMRIIAAIILGFLSWGTGRFLIVYTFSGLTDVLDGWLARTVIVKIVVSKILIFYWLHIHLGCRTLLWTESNCQRQDKLLHNH